MIEVVLGLLSLPGGLLVGSLANAAADRALLRERWRAASGPMAALGVGMGVAATGPVFRMAAIALDPQRVVALADLTLLAIVTAAVLLLVPRHSYNGASIAAVLARLRSAVSCAVIARRAGLTPPLGSVAKRLTKAPSRPAPFGC